MKEFCRKASRQASERVSNSYVFVVLLNPMHSRTVSIFVWKILTLMSVDSRSEFHVFFGCRGASRALPTLAFRFSSDPPCLSMKQSKSVKHSTCSRVSPSTVTELVPPVKFCGLFSLVNVEACWYTGFPHLCLLVRMR